MRKKRGFQRRTGLLLAGGMLMQLMPGVSHTVHAEEALPAGTVDRFAYMTEDGGDMVIPDSVNAVYTCSYIGYTTLTIGKNVSSIIYEYIVDDANQQNNPDYDPAYADVDYPAVTFQDQYQLEEIYVDEENQWYCAEDGVLYNKDKTILYDVAPLHEFPDGVLTIPASVKEIANPITAKNVKAFAVEDGNTEYTVIDGVLFDTEQKTLVQYPAGAETAHYTIPSGTETIGKRAFYEVLLVRVTISEGVTVIEEAAFYNSTLEFAELPETLKIIKGRAFRNTDLIFITIPAAVEVIETGAFWDTYNSMISIRFDHDGTAPLNIAEQFEERWFTGNNGSSIEFMTETVYYAYDEAEIDTFFPEHFVSRHRETSGTCGENLTWSLQDATLTISGEGEMTECEAGAYPWSGLNVMEVVFDGTGIIAAPYAFYGEKTIFTASLSGVTFIGPGAFQMCENLFRITEHDAVSYTGAKALERTEWSLTVQDETGLNRLGSVLVYCTQAEGTAEIPEHITYVAEDAFSSSRITGLSVPMTGVVYNPRAFAGNSTLEHVRFTGSGTDITLADFQAAAVDLKEIELTDEAGNVIQAVGYTKENSLLYLANALSGTPYITQLHHAYSHEILTQYGFTASMTDAELAAAAYDHAVDTITYGFCYAEDENGIYSGAGTTWSLCPGFSHQEVGPLVIKRGVCSAYTDVIEGLIEAMQQKELTTTLQAKRSTGLNHEWNVIGLNTGTSYEKWYYLDATNRMFLVGYENPTIIASSAMFDYDASVPRNSDGTYTITLTDGTEIRLQGDDYTGDTVIRGDASLDGAVSIDDATIALSVYAMQAAGLSIERYSAVQQSAADADADSTVTITDATAILVYYARGAAGLTADWDEILGVA